MSRLLSLALTAVSALALSTAAATFTPLDEFASTFEGAAGGSYRIGNWCC